MLRKLTGKLRRRGRLTPAPLNKNQPSRQLKFAWGSMEIIFYRSQGQSKRYRSYETMWFKTIILSLSVLFLVGPAHATNARDAIAFWLSIRGEINPAVAPMSEVVTRTKYLLSAGARVKFFHLKRCRVVTIENGAIEIRRTGYSLSSGAKVVSEKKRRCHSLIKLKSKSDNTALGGVVFRSSQKARPEIYGPTPAFFIIGKKANSAKKIKITGVLPNFIYLNIINSGARWPLDAAKLAVGHSYNLTLLGQHGVELGGIVFSVTSSGDKDNVLKLD